MRRSFTDRMIAAAKLDIDLYEEVEADTDATMQAALVVTLAAVASGIGGINGGATGIIGGVVGAIIGWLIWAAVTYFIGDKLLGGTATWGELLRTLGFAQAPRLLLIFAAVPLLGGVVAFVVGIWVFVAGIIAIRQALDFSTGRAVATALLGFIPSALLIAVFR